MITVTITSNIWHEYKKVTYCRFDNIIWRQQELFANRKLKDKQDLALLTSRSDFPGEWYREYKKKMGTIRMPRPASKNPISVEGNEREGFRKFMKVAEPSVPCTYTLCLSNVLLLLSLIMFLWEKP